MILKLLFFAVPLLAQDAYATGQPGSTSLGQCTQGETLTKTVFVTRTAKESMIDSTTVTTLQTTTEASSSSSAGSSSSATSSSTAIAPPAALPASLKPAPKGNQNLQNALYFTNWGIYGARFLPQSVPGDRITHLLYAFANITANGTVVSSDPYADVQIMFNGDAKRYGGNDAFGCVKQLYIQKQQNRKLKTLLSIGGWTYSQEGYFKGATSSADGRATFAQSAVTLLADWGFDGLDIDWEYPANAQEADDFVQLLRACRVALDEYAVQNGQNYHYLLTVATGAGPQNYRKLNLNGMDAFIDNWNLMAYDYAGSWDQTTGYQSNLFASASDPHTTPFNTEQAVKDYLAAGIRPEKLILGLPIYGRSFSNTDGIGKSFDGVGPGDPEAGVWPYRDLPKAGATVHFDKALGATYSYDPQTKELISYDDVRSTAVKADYVLQKGLGGALFWEASGDKLGSQSLVLAMEKALGKLDQSQNQLDYPQSHFDNIRNGMPRA